MTKPLLESRPVVEIKQTPDVCGGVPRVGNKRITMHGLVAWRRLGLADEEILDQIEGLTRDELRAAWTITKRTPMRSMRCWLGKRQTEIHGASAGG